MTTKRLADLERQIDEITHSDQFVTVVFTDGTKQTEKLADCIPIVQSETVRDIIGEDSKRNGKLFQLIRDLIEREE